MRARHSRAYGTQPTMLIKMTRVSRSLTMMAEAAMNSGSGGMDSWMSASRISTASSQPPR